MFYNKEAVALHLIQRNAKALFKVLIQHIAVTI